MFSDLRGRGKRDHADPGRMSTENVDKEREAWRKHFASISGDVGLLNNGNESQSGHVPRNLHLDMGAC